MPAEEQAEMKTKHLIGNILRLPAPSSFPLCGADVMRKPVPELNGFPRL